MSGLIHNNEVKGPLVAITKRINIAKNIEDEICAIDNETNSFISKLLGMRK